MKMTVIQCVLASGVSGALLGLTVGMASSWLVPSMVERSREAQLGEVRLPAPPLNDVNGVRALFLYGIPLAFASVGAGVAYYLCMEGMI